MISGIIDLLVSTWSPLPKLGEFEVKEVVCTGSARRGERASRVTMVTIAKRGFSNTAEVNWRVSVLSEGIFRQAAHLLSHRP